jgi:DNA-binding NarL/FixJ family response regulator
MPRVLALVPDLLFGSRVQAALRAAGDEVELLSDAAALRRELGESSAQTVVVIDLADARLQGAQLLAELRREGLLEDVAAVAFYSHVDVAAREAAQRAGFDLVVPRSRMAREAAQLVARARAAR